MRTTVTLDTDVAELLRDATHRSRTSFKATLNAAIRLGLSGGHKPAASKSFKLKTRPLRLRSGLDPAGFNKLADELEVDAFIAKTRRLQGK